MSEKKLEVKVDYRQVSVGDNVARLGVKIGRSEMASDEAEKFLCGSRLQGEIRIDDPSTPELDGMPEVQAITEAFDVVGYSANRKAFSCGFAFNVSDVDVELLSHFPGKSGCISVKRLGKMPEKRGRQKKED